MKVMWSPPGTIMQMIADLEVNAPNVCAIQIYIVNLLYTFCYSSS